MNNVKFYRYTFDGSVQMAVVRIAQPSLATRRKTPRVVNLRIAENEMLRQGFTRHKLKPTHRLTLPDSVAHAFRSMV